MKEFFVLLLLFFISILNVSAKNIPLYTTSISKTGIGLINLPSEFIIYEAPDENSKIIKKYSLHFSNSSYVKDRDYSDNFVIYNPNTKLAYMTVLEESDNNWFEICYDQKEGLTGWVKPKKYLYYNWISFFNKYGKENGLYAYRDISIEKKWLYSRPDENAQIISSFENSKNIRAQLFKGNWVLVRVYDIEGRLKIGWLKWRTEEGNFNYFPILK